MSKIVYLFAAWLLLIAGISMAAGVKDGPNFAWTKVECGHVTSTIGNGQPSWAYLDVETENCGTVTLYDATSINVFCALKAARSDAAFSYRAGWVWGTRVYLDNVKVKVVDSVDLARFDQCPVQPRAKLP